MVGTYFTAFEQTEINSQSSNLLIIATAVTCAD